MPTDQTAVTPSTPATPPNSNIRHLLLSFPELEVPHDGRDVIDALVEGAICELLRETGPSRMVILHDVAIAIRQKAGLEFEPAELVASFERLERRDRISFRDETHRSFLYSESAFNSAREAVDRRTGAWEALQLAWQDEIRRRHKLDDLSCEHLWQGLDAFVARLVNTHAAEAAAFLYVTDSEGQSRFYRLLNQRLPDVEELVSTELVDIARTEYPQFFDPANETRAEYLTSRMRAAFFFHLLSLDPSASALVREHVADKVLYLDSNFLFRLFGFHGPALAYPASTAVEISKQLGCQLLVAKQTADEYVRVVKANLGLLRATPITRDAYLRVAAGHPSDEGDFMRAFYRDLQSGQVKSADQFGRKWLDVRAWLAHWGIQVDEDASGSEDERNAEAFLDEMSQLNQWTHNSRNPAALEHDTFMLRLIRMKRSASDSTRGRIKFWFLSFDRQLTQFSAYYATEAQAPAVVLASDWLQIARPFLPRTHDYAKAFVAMLRYPMLYEGSARVPFAHMAEALSRLERFQELPEEVVGAMVADEEFIRRLRAADRDEDARAVIELKASAVAANAIRQNEQLRQQVEHTRHQIASLEERVETLNTTRDALDRERATALAEAQAAKEAAASDVDTRIAELKKEIAAARASERERGGRRQRWTAYFCLAGMLTVVTASMLVIQWPSLTTAQRLVIAAWVPISWAILLLIPKGPSLALALTASLASIGGWILITIQMWYPR